MTGAVARAQALCSHATSLAVLARELVALSRNTRHAIVLRRARAGRRPR
jgi:hypothetical protein